jgi:hypothetical protein
MGDTQCMADLSKTEAQRDTNLERPDPPHHPAQNTGPREKQEADPQRVERAREEWDRTIAT